MAHRRLLIAATIAALFALPAPAAAAVHVQLRVEGPRGTLFQGSVVPVRGTLRDTKGVRHRTSRRTALGALVRASRLRHWPLRLKWFDLGTGGWSGFFVAGIDRIVPDGTRHTWGFKIGHAAASKGAGSIRARRGMRILFYYTRLTPSFHTEPTLGLTLRPRHPRTRALVTFRVTAYDDHGVAAPAAGAWVWIDGTGVRADASGRVQVRLRHGRHRVRATRFRSIRSPRLWVRAGR